MVKVVGLDPGKQRDSFGIVACEKLEGKIRVKNAQRILGMNYLDVEDYLESLHKAHKFNFFILEVNNTGTHVYEVLRKKGLPVIPVTTVAEIKDPSKKNDLKRMEKNEMVRNMIHWFQDGKIVFPTNCNAELNELKRQLSIFSEVKTETGKVSYRAEGQEHDDLVMALMLACWFLKPYELTVKTVNTLKYLDEE